MSGQRCLQLKCTIAVEAVERNRNLTIHERIRPSKINADDYQLFLENDYEFAMKYGNDISFLKRNNAEFS